MTSGWNRLRRRHAEAGQIARLEKARRIGFGGRQDPANWLVVTALAMLVLVIAGTAVLTMRSAGMFTPPMIKPIEDPRRLTNLRVDLATRPIIDTVWHAPEQALYVLRRKNLIQRYHQPTALWRDETPEAVAGDIIHLQSGCGDDPRLSASDSACSAPETLWALTDQGALLSRRSGDWQVVAGGTAFLTPGSLPVSGEALTAVGRSVDGQYLLFGAGANGLGLYDINARRWISLPTEQASAIAQANVRDIRAVGDGFAIATGDGLYALTKAGTAKSTLKAHEEILGAVRLMAADGDGRLLVLEDKPCIGNKGLTCQRLSRLSEPLDAPTVLFDEKTRNSELQLSDLNGVYWVDDHLVLTSPAGVFAYDEANHGFLEIEAARISTARMDDDGNLYYGYPGGVGKLARVDREPERWGLSGGQRPEQIQFIPDDGGALALTELGEVHHLQDKTAVDAQFVPTGLPPSLANLRHVATVGDSLLFVAPPKPGQVISDKSCGDAFVGWHNVARRTWTQVWCGQYPAWLLDEDLKTVQLDSDRQPAALRPYTPRLAGLRTNGDKTDGGVIRLDDDCINNSRCTAEISFQPAPGKLLQVWAWEEGVVAATDKGSLLKWNLNASRDRQGNVINTSYSELIGAVPKELADSGQISDASLSNDSVVLASPAGSFEYDLVQRKWTVLDTGLNRAVNSAIHEPTTITKLGLTREGTLLRLGTADQIYGRSAVDLAGNGGTAFADVVESERLFLAATQRGIKVYDRGWRRWVADYAMPDTPTILGASGGQPVSVLRGGLYVGKYGGRLESLLKVSNPVLDGQADDSFITDSSMLAVMRRPSVQPMIELHDWLRLKSLVTNPLTGDKAPVACISATPFAGLGVKTLRDAVDLGPLGVALLHDRGVSLYQERTGNWSSLVSVPRGVSAAARLFRAGDNLALVDQGQLWRVNLPASGAGLDSRFSCTERAEDFSEPRQSVALDVLKLNARTLVWIDEKGAVNIDNGLASELAGFGAPGSPMSDLGPGKVRRIHRMDRVLWFETASGLSAYDLDDRTWQSWGQRWIGADDNGVSLLAGTARQPVVLAANNGRQPRIGKVSSPASGASNSGLPPSLTLGPLDLPGSASGWRKPAQGLTDSMEWKGNWVFAFRNGLKFYDPLSGQWVEYGPLPDDPDRNLRSFGDDLVVFERGDVAWVSTAGRRVSGTTLERDFVRRKASTLSGSKPVVTAPQSAIPLRLNGDVISLLEGGRYDLQADGTVDLCAGRNMAECTTIWPPRPESRVTRPDRQWLVGDLILLADEAQMDVVYASSFKRAITSPVSLRGQGGVAEVGKLSETSMLVRLGNGRLYALEAGYGPIWLRPNGQRGVQDINAITIAQLGEATARDVQGTTWRLQKTGPGLYNLQETQIPAQPWDPARQISGTSTQFDLTDGQRRLSSLPWKRASDIGALNGNLLLTLSDGSTERRSDLPARSDVIGDAPLQIGDFRSTANGQNMRLSNAQNSHVFAIESLLAGGKFFNQPDAPLALNGPDTVVMALNGHLWHLPVNVDTGTVDWPKAVIPLPLGTQVAEGAPEGFADAQGQLITVDGRVQRRQAWRDSQFGSLTISPRPADLKLGAESVITTRGLLIDLRLKLAEDRGRLLIGTPLGFEDSTSPLSFITGADAARLAQKTVTQDPIGSPAPGAFLRWQREASGGGVYATHALTGTRIDPQFNPGYGLGFLTDFPLEYVLARSSQGQARDMLMATPGGLVRLSIVPAGDAVGIQRSLLALGNYSDAKLMRLDGKLYLGKDGKTYTVDLDRNQLATVPENPFISRNLTSDDAVQWRYENGQIKPILRYLDLQGRPQQYEASLSRNGFAHDEFTALLRDGHDIWLGTAMGVERHTLAGVQQPVNLALLQNPRSDAAWALGQITDLSELKTSQGFIRAIGDGGCWLLPKQGAGQPRICTAQEAAAPGLLLSSSYWEWYRNANGQISYSYLGSNGRRTAGPYAPDGKAFPHDRIVSMASCNPAFPSLQLAENGLVTIKGGKGGNRGLGVTTTHISNVQDVQLDCMNTDPAKSVLEPHQPFIFSSNGIATVDVNKTIARVNDGNVIRLREAARLDAQWQHLRLRKHQQGSKPQFELLMDGEWVPIPWSKGRLAMDQGVGVLSSNLRMWVMTPMGFTPLTVSMVKQETKDRQALYEPDGKAGFKSLPTGCGTGESAARDVQAVGTSLRFVCGDARWQASLEKGELVYKALEGEAADSFGFEEDGWKVDRVLGKKGVEYRIARWDQPRRLSSGRFGFDQIRSLGVNETGWDVATGAAGWMRVKGDDFELTDWAPPENVSIDPKSVLRLTRTADDGALCLDIEQGRSVVLAADGQLTEKAACLETLAQDGLWTYQRGDAGGLVIEASPRGGGIARRSLENGRFADDVAIGFAVPVDGDDDAALVMPSRAGLLRIKRDGSPVGLSIPDFDGLQRGEIPTAIMASRDGDSVMWVAGSSLTGESSPASDLQLRRALPQGSRLIGLGRGPRGQLRLRWVYNNLIGTSIAGGEGDPQLSTQTIDLTTWAAFIANRERWGDPQAAMDIAVGENAIGLRLPGDESEQVVAGTENSKIITTATGGELYYIVEPDELRILDLSQLMQQAFDRRYGRQ